MAIGMLLHDLHAGEGAGTCPHALVVFLFSVGTGLDQVLTFARRWKPTVPQAALIGIELNHVTRQPDIAGLGRAIATAASLRSVQLSQTILLGAGAAGRLALDMVLEGVVPAMGVIGLDISLGVIPSRIERTAAMVRLIQHRAGEYAPAGFRALVEAMQQQDIDVRTTVLPEIAEAASAMTQRAGATFLVELVASASRFPLATRR
jgi:hypothetical protein